MGKVTMQDIADELMVSRVSVWKVFNKPSEVSEALKNRVVEKAYELGYIKGHQELHPPKESKTISVIVSRPESSLFWTDIINQIAQELSRKQINLMYTYIGTSAEGAAHLPASITNGSIDGAIVLNVYDTALLAAINQMPFPKVYLDTVPDLPQQKLNGDLLLIEGRDSMYKITESLIKNEFTNIGFIGDIQYAQTNLDRYHGFRACLKDYSMELQKQICLTNSIGIYSYLKELYAFLDGLKTIPQAFVCASDYIAHFVKQYFWEHPHRLPDNFRVTGFDGNSEYTNVSGNITTAMVCTDSLGIRLTTQLLYRMAHPKAPYECVYINSKVIYKDARI